MKLMIFILFAMLSGCTDLMEPRLKCQDGVIYMKVSGVWVQALLYEKNKCLPIVEAK